MSIEPKLLSEEFLKRSPPLLRLVSQAVSSSDFEELIRVRAFLDVRFRHDHVEGPCGFFLLVSQQKCRFTSPTVNTKRHEAINCKNIARPLVDNVGPSVLRSGSRSRMSGSLNPCRVHRHFTS